MTDLVKAWAPASVSNLGPGFDALGIALSSWGDEISVRLMYEESTRSLIYDPEGVWTGTDVLKENTAGVAALEVAAIGEYEGGFELTIKKGVRAGSGVGSSAASAVAAAVAMNAALGAHLSKVELIPAVLKGEAIVSGVEHGDNVMPALLGGIVLMRSESPSEFSTLPPPQGMRLVIVLPEVEVLTKTARTLLPDSVTLHEAVDHAARLSLLVDALHRNDVARVGELIMSDDIVEPCRAVLVKPYELLKRAALDAGAAGCALSGSGPAMFAITTSASSAEQIEKAFQSVCDASSIRCITTIDQVNQEGARII